MNHKELLEEAKKGSDKAIEKIIINLDPYIRKYTLKYFSNLHYSEDFHQMARMGIWMAIKKVPKVKYKVRITKNKIYFYEDKKYDIYATFMKYVRNSIMHFITREIRKENQICRKIEKKLLYTNEDNTIIDNISNDDDILNHSLYRLKELADNFTEKEKYCFKHIIENTPFNKMYEHMKTKYTKCSRNEIRRIKELVSNKVRMEILKYS